MATPQEELINTLAQTIASFLSPVLNPPAVQAGAGLTRSSGPSSAGTLSLASSGVEAGTYTYATISVDQYGRITAASSNTASGIQQGADKRVPRWSTTGLIDSQIQDDGVSVAIGAALIPGSRLNVGGKVDATDFQASAKVEAKDLVATTLADVKDLKVGTLDGVLKANGASPATALTGAPNKVTRWTNATTLGTGALGDDGAMVSIGPLFTVDSANGNVSTQGTILTSGISIASGVPAANTLKTQAIVVTGGSPAADKVLTATDASGNATWKSPGVPIGAIIMWSGAVIPAGWALCDGANGTPDLRSRFIVGASLGAGPALPAPTYTVGNSGAPDNHTHTVAISATTTADGAHHHTVSHGPIAVHNLTTQTNASAPLTAVLTSDAPDHTHDVSANVNTGSLPNAEQNRPRWFALYFIMKISS